jgi:hypothetical protein
MERVKNACLVLCVFVVLLVIFGSYFRANEIGALCGALAGTPVLVHVFNRVVPARRRPGCPLAQTVEPRAQSQPAAERAEHVLVVRMESPHGRG